MANHAAGVLLVLVVMAIPMPVLARSGSGDAALAGVTATDPAIASASVAALRGRGPEGLRMLLDAYASEIAAARIGDVEPERWNRLRAAIDAVAGQRDADTSGLFWYTDLEEAKLAATASRRPILSLRLLGRLDQELSCANSRFFRTALYANREVSAYLREHFVLHWASERPAPKITIDYGDGRRIVRTITGNSIHYVLDERGRLVDAIPGLYGTRTFLERLTVAEAEARQIARFDGATRVAHLKRYLREQSALASTSWVTSVGRLLVPGDLGSGPTAKRPPTPAAAAGRLAITKSLVEIPSLRALDLETDLAKRLPDDPIWEALASARAADSSLDAASLRLMRSQLAPDLRHDESAFQTMVQRFERSIAVDTVHNEFVLRPQILRWLATTDGPVDVDALDSWVYETVFLTPRSDPWLGLLPPDVYTAIENGGVTHQ